MVFLRENTEGLYSGIGGVVGTGGVGQVASDTRIITRKSSERIIRLALKWPCNAMVRLKMAKSADVHRKTTSCMDAAFAEIFEEIGKEFPEVEQDVAIVDAFTVAHRSTRVL